MKRSSMPCLVSRLHTLDAMACAARLPVAAHALAPLLEGEQDGVRLAAARTLIALIEGCLDEKAVESAVGMSGMVMRAANRPIAPAVSVVAAILGALSAQHRSAWSNALPGTPSMLCTNACLHTFARFLGRIPWMARSCVDGPDDNALGDTL